MHVTANATVSAPIDTVWAVLTDHAGMAGWAPGLSVTLGRPGTPEPNGLGAVRKVSTAAPGPDIVEEVTRFDAPHVFGYKGVSGIPFPGYAGEVRLTSAGAATRIEYTVSSTATFGLVRVPLAAISQVMLRLLVRAVSRA